MLGESKEATYLSAAQLQSLSVTNGFLMWQDGDDSKTVEAHCAFPLSYPDKYIVLRDPEDQEIGIIETLAPLKPEVSEAILEQLNKRYFLPQILRINKMTERFGSAIWDLETDRGRIVISTRQLNEAVRELGPSRFLVVDVDGNRYEIKELRDLPPESQAHFIGR